MNRNPLTRYPKTVYFCLGCLSALAMAPLYFWPFMAAGYTALVFGLLRTESVKTAFVHTWLFFFGYFMASLYWVSHALTIDIHLWWWALPFSFTGLPFLLAFFPAICTAGIAAIRKRIALPLISTWALFVTALFMADYARATLFTGFPWNLPLHTWATTPIMMDMLPFIGFYPLNLLTITLFTLPALIIIGKAAHNRRASIFACIMAVALVGLIFAPPAVSDKMRRLTTMEKIGHQYQIHMIQANIAQNIKWDPQYIWQNFETYLDMSHAAIGNTDKPAIIIWPETATSLNLLSFERAQQRFREFLGNLPQGSLLITGFLNSHYQGDAPKHYNSVAVFDTDGNIVAQYDKHHLVPFGEFIPFQSYIPVGPVTGFEGFQSGMPPKPLQLAKPYDLNILPLICYEIIFPRVIEKNSDNTIIINATNDAWFGKTAGAYQHFDHALFRARENNIAVLRLSGNGISAIIDSDGHVHRATRLNQKDKISFPFP